MSYEETLQAFRSGDNAEAGRLARLDLDAAVDAGDAAGQVDALCMLGRVALRQQDLESVMARALEADRVARSSGDRRLRRMPVHLQAVSARMAGDFGKARDLYEESIRLNDELGEVRFAALEHRNLAYGELRAGNESRARELFAESERRLSGQDVSGFVAYLIFDEATVACLDGDLVRARQKLREADAQFEAAGVVPDPDDAAEIERLRKLLATGTDG